MRNPIINFFFRKEHILLGIVVFVSSALMSMSNNSTMDTPRLWILGMLGIVGEKIGHIENKFNLAEENAQLQRLNAELTLKNAQLREAYLENKRLRELLTFEQELPLNFVPVRVIGTSSREFITSVILNAGSEQGLRKDLPLVTYNGLVGKLYSVGKNQSIGQLLIDGNFRVSGRVQDSRVTGIVRWLEGNILALEHVPKRSEVKVGDSVVTSGLTTMFPKGLQIGTVSEVSEDIAGLFMKVRLTPEVDFSKLEELFVVWE